MALGTSAGSLSPTALTHVPRPPDPSLVAPPADPRSDPSFHTAHPDNHPAPTSISPAITPSSPSSSSMDASISNPALAPAPFTTSLNPDVGVQAPAGPEQDASPASSGIPTFEVDPQIIEALKSKDRIYVLKLGETFEALIMERRTRVELSPATSYQRLLVHRCSAYYRLTPESDPVTKALFVLTTSDSRIPDRRISELVPAESTTQPAFKIMRRSAADRRAKPRSHAGSVAGDDQESSDVEQSESGSLGGRSSKKRMTIEEREAAYNEARSRIFMDFEEKGKDKDMSASSSTLSLNGSASTSAGGRSSAGDTDDGISSPATESEWSVPSGSNSRDKKDGRRGGPGSASASSTRSLRGGSFHGNGSGGSSRNSRAPSPSFSYASLHDSPMGHIYDPSQPHGPNQAYYANQYSYPYSPPGSGPSPSFMPQYQYYSQHYNPYQSPPPMPPHNPADPTTPSGPEAYSSSHHMNYGPHYGWPPHPQQPPLQSPPHSMQIPLPQQPQQSGHPAGMPPSLPPHSPQYQPFLHPAHAYTYPLNGYYQPPPQIPGQQGPPPPTHMVIQSPPPQHQQVSQAQHQLPQQHQPQPQMHQQQNYDMHRGTGNQIGHSPSGPFSHSSNGSRSSLGNGVIPPNNSARTGPRNNSINVPPVNGNSMKSSRVPAPSPARGAWSYGPGVGIGGYTAPVIPGGDAMGPRFNNTPRRSSANSASTNSRASPNDDVSSTSSSTTSSSSRRTYTSTTSSQHPLPARPDWAVGLKAQPTLAGGRHHDLSHTNTRGISPISPPRSNGHNSPMPDRNSPRQPSTIQSSISLQATDFPPLTSGGIAQEKKAPIAAGAWGNARSVLTSANGTSSTTSNNGNGNFVNRQEENSPKSGDMISPKITRRPVSVNGQAYSRSPGDKIKDSMASPVMLAAHVASLSIMDETGAESSGIDEVHTRAAPSMPASLPQHDKELAVLASPLM